MCDEEATESKRRYAVDGILDEWVSRIQEIRILGA